jgi:D-alanine-D-alanine ligase
MHIAGVFELLKIPYTGSGPITLGTCLNKVRTKEILSYHGIPTPKFAVFKSAARVTLDDGMQFPLFVKPAREDASSNDSVVYDVPSLRKRVRYVHQNHDQPVLVEEFIEGRELNVAVMGNRKPFVLPISEIDFSAMPDSLHRIVSYECKWVAESDEYRTTKGICPAKLPSAVEAKMREIALHAYRLMGCRDYARVDMRLNKNNQPFVLEVNPNPDISRDAGFVRSVKAAGLTFEEMVGMIIEYALERNP